MNNNLKQVEKGNYNTVEQERYKLLVRVVRQLLCQNYFHVRNLYFNIFMIALA